MTGANTIARQLRAWMFAVTAALAWSVTCLPSAWAQDVKQMSLTDQQIENFIKAQADLAEIAPKIQDAGEAPDAELQKQLESIASKHGFKNFAELDDVAANISIVLSGLDSESGEFVDPVDALKKEMEDVKADPTIPAADKAQLVDELAETIKTTAPLAFTENVARVKAHRDQLEKALE